MTPTRSRRTQPAILSLLLVPLLLAVGLVTATPASAAGGGYNTINNRSSTGAVYALGIHKSQGRVHEGLIAPGQAATEFWRVDFIRATFNGTMRCTDSYGKRTTHVLTAGVRRNACPGHQQMLITNGGL